jgi:aryl-alcohol dehydrogenase-like predicted oxidoreductase
MAYVHESRHTLFLANNVPAAALENRYTKTITFVQVSLIMDQDAYSIHAARRQWLKDGSIAFSAIALGQPFVTQAATGIFRAIPKSGEALPVIGLGTYISFDLGSTASERDPAKEVLQRFVELGGTVVDSSPMYGRAEAVVGELSTELKVKEKLWLATKVWTQGLEAGIAQMNESLRKLQRQKIELMQVHNLLDTKTHLNTLRDWKKSGKIKYLGVTHYHAGAYDALEQVLKPGDMDFVQLNFSIAEREAEQRILKVAADAGTAVIVNRPYATGSLFSQVKDKPLPVWASEIDCTSWGQFFLKYILGHPAVTCVIPATRNPKHLIDNMGAGHGRLPDAAMRKKMLEHFASL